MRLKRRDLQRLSATRLREAKALLEARCWSGAYYLAGYAVECALKASIARSTARFEFPDLDRVRSSYTHDLEKLLVVAGIEETLKDDRRRQPALTANWQIVTQWSEQSRYERKSEDTARTLIRAVADGEYGILRWLEKHW